jgi:nucleotide-binding universal stress UspA family protein
MFKTILWATDGSETAAQALPYVLELTENASAKLVIGHVREIYGGRSAGYPVYADDTDIRAQVEKQVKDLAETGVNATFVERNAMQGHTAKMIGEIAEEHGAELIVVGTRGHSRIGTLLIGSVTQELLHQHKAPVLAVPTGVAAGVEAEAVTA